MTGNTKPTSSRTPCAPTALKATPVAPGGVPLRNPPTPPKAAPAQTEIAKKAYEIWFSQGQPTGHDQQHWYEAEQQLQHA